jgi:methionyl-tRNA synthetase
MISYDDFSKLDLRVGKIVAVEAVESSHKLLKLKVDLGQPFGERTIVAGIKKMYTTEELLGQLVVVLANLEPKELAGIKSEGMLLCACPESVDQLRTDSVKEQTKENGPVLLVPLNQVHPGTKIR